MIKLKLLLLLVIYIAIVNNLNNNGIERSNNYISPDISGLYRSLVSNADIILK